MVALAPEQKWIPAFAGMTAKQDTRYSHWREACIANIVFKSLVTAIKM
jgi:hypothetical protein